MAERRLPILTGTPIALKGWVVSAGHPLIEQRFYAAFATADALCWTDDPGRAACFPEPADAERFAETFCPDEDWEISR